MKIVNISGGLGNQMFQYALAISLSERFKEPTYIDTSHYKYLFSKTFRGNNFYHNGYEISRIFCNSQIKTASIWQILKVSYYVPNYVLSRFLRRLLPLRKSEFIQIDSQAYSYIDDIFKSCNYEYFEGYWQSAKYFENIRNKIIFTFEFPKFIKPCNIKYANLLSKNESVTIHIRRGDFLSDPLYKGICTLDYYKNAIDKVKELFTDPIFFVFSNDQDWCIENLKDQFGKSQVIFVNDNTGDDSYRDMQLMTLARCNILANSSFSWWGAYLNKRDDQIVFVPNIWVNNVPCEDIYLNNWIKIKG